MSPQPPTFLSCDWGTTAFRLRLVSAGDYKIIAEESSKQGNAAVNESWKATAQPESGRLAYYLYILQQSIKAIEVTTGDVLDGIPLIISGMASSTIGMMEIPYKVAPFALDGSDLRTAWIGSTNTFPHDILLISGVKTADDVMRGEEVQVVGCDISNTQEEQLIIHPGTHSKHITVKDGQATTFRTYMTGEMFALLSAKSILAASIAHNRNYDKDSSRRAFAEGVKDATGNLLHTLFLIRTSDLFKKRTKEEAHHYLSGLLIGSELNTFPENYSGNIILAGEHGLVKQYKEAIDLMGISKKTAGIILKDAVEITLKGQYAVYSQQKESAHAAR